MVDQFLTAKVAIAFKEQIQTNADLWKDEVMVRLTLGRRAETRTVQGGGIDVLPAEIISSGEFEVPLTTDVIETVDPPINPDSLSFWTQAIFDGNFPLITIIKQDENRDADKATILFTARVTEVVPGDKEEGNADVKTIIRFIPVTYTSWLRT